MTRLKRYNLIAIETSSDVCGVAAFSDGRLVQQLAVDEARSHSIRLAGMIKKVLTESLSDALDVIAVSSGPGSFTGLRIGVSTAKGLAFARNARLVSVLTMEGVARAALRRKSDAESVIVLTPSRRGELYWSGYRTNSEGRTERFFEEAAIPVASFEESVRQKGLMNSYIAMSAPIPELDPVFERIPDVHVEIVKPTAVEVGYCALLRVDQEEYEDLSAFEPYYLQPVHVKKPNLSALDRLAF